jgi:hypothetical protein
MMGGYFLPLEDATRAAQNTQAQPTHLYV